MSEKCSKVILLLQGRGTYSFLRPGDACVASQDIVNDINRSNCLRLATGSSTKTYHVFPTCSVIEIIVEDLPSEEAV